MLISYNIIISNTNFVMLNIICTLLIKSKGSEFCDKPAIENDHQSEVDKCHTANTGNSNGKDMALVLYNENDVLPLHRQERTFKYLSQDIVIKQNWKELGVAAVVWDAVRINQNK